MDFISFHVLGQGLCIWLHFFFPRMAGSQEFIQPWIVKNLSQPHLLHWPRKGKERKETIAFIWLFIYLTFLPSCIFNFLFVRCYLFAEFAYCLPLVSEINLSVIGPYVDYLTEKQGVKRIFGKNLSLVLKLDHWLKHLREPSFCGVFCLFVCFLKYCIKIYFIFLV